jgi:DNA-binding MarR family transcriptional regulator
MSAGPLKQPQGCTNFKIRQLMRRVSQHYDAELARAGLKATQYSLLGYVQKLGPVRPGELARTIGIDPSTLTRNLKPLVAAGWLLVESGPDERSRTVTITDAGRAKRSEGQRFWKAAQEKVNEILGAERVLALHSLIDDSLRLLPTTEEGARHV